MISEEELSTEINNFRKEISERENVCIQWEAFTTAHLKKSSLKKKSDAVLYIFSAFNQVTYVGVSTVFYGASMRIDPKTGANYFYGPRYASNYRGILGTILTGLGRIYTGKILDEHDTHAKAQFLADTAFELGILKPTEKLFEGLERQLIWDFDSVYNDGKDKVDQNIKISHHGLPTEFKKS
jgi:hypothetical protein